MYLFNSIKYFTIFQLKIISRSYICRSYFCTPILKISVLRGEYRKLHFKTEKAYVWGLVGGAFRGRQNNSYISSPFKTRSPGPKPSLSSNTESSIGKLKVLLIFQHISSNFPWHLFTVKYKIHDNQPFSTELFLVSLWNRK